MRLNKKSKLITITLLLLTAIIIMPSCGGSKEITYEMKSLSQVVIANDDTVVLDVMIYYPEITGGLSKSVTEKLNMEFYGIAERDSMASDFSDEALEAYDEGYVQMPYEFSTTVAVEYLKNDIISLVYNQYVYLGGAHPSTYESSYTYNTKNGELLQPQDIMGGTHDEIIAQVKQLFIDDVNNYPDDYFDDSIEMINEVSDEAIGYYLNDTGLVFYMNHYEIAPYSSGIRSVMIPFEVK